MPENFDNQTRKEIIMGTIQIKRGLSANLPAHAAVGEILYTTDTKKFYIGNGNEQPLTEFDNYAQIIELLNQKSENNHKHTAVDITDFTTSVDSRITAQKGKKNGLATLDANGLIPTSQIPAEYKEAQVVSNIAARDTLNAFAGLHALVLDATGDNTVATGGAEYIYDGTKWVKVSELNDLDAVITWANIQNKPDFVDSLLDLSDTPSSFTNQAGKVLVVKNDESGLEFTSVYSGDVDGGTF